jgi:hypothetical protein
LISRSASLGQARRIAADACSDSQALTAWLSLLASSEQLAHGGFLQRWRGG